MQKAKTDQVKTYLKKDSKHKKTKAPFSFI